MTRTPALRAVALAAALAALLDAPARADDVIVFGGNVRQRTQIAAVRGAIENTLRKAGWTWPDRAPTAREASSLFECEDAGALAACVPARIAGVRTDQATRVLVASLDAQTASPAVLVITAKVIVARPPAIVVGQRACERCSTAQLARASEELIRQLLGEIAAPPALTAFDVRSEPEGADITLDGVHAGITNTRLATSPGTHVAVIEKAGFIAETRPLTIEAGQTVEISVVLRHLEPPATRSLAEPRPVASATRPGSRLVPGLVIASGVATMVLGGVALYYGHQEGPGEQYRYTRATTVGWIAGSVGAVTIGAGFYLWRRRSGSGLIGVIGNGSPMLAWSSRM